MQPGKRLDGEEGDSVLPHLGLEVDPGGVDALAGELGSPIDDLIQDLEPAAGEDVYPGEGTDVDDVTGAASNHLRDHGAGNQEHAFQIGV